MQQVGITDVQMAGVTPNGVSETAHAQSTFSASKDRKIIAALTLDEHVMVTGTTISFVRIRGCTYTPWAPYTLQKAQSNFYVEFDAGAGKTFTPGHYRLRFSVNQKPAWDIAYDVVP